MPRPIPATSSASATRGIWFVFDHAGHSIALWVSSFTGKEELYVNGVLTRERRKIALNATHEFEIGDSQYQLRLTTISIRRGIFECLLSENGLVVAGQQTEYVTKRRWQQSLLVGGGAALFVYLDFAGKLSSLASLAGIAAVAWLYFALLGRGDGYVIRPVAASVLNSNPGAGNGAGSAS
jgi:hypothetical protein